MSLLLVVLLAQIALAVPIAQYFVVEDPWTLQNYGGYDGYGGYGGYRRYAGYGGYGDYGRSLGLRSYGAYYGY